GIAASLIIWCSASLRANNNASKVVLRESFSAQHRGQLTEKLRAITGWSDLEFDSNGTLQLGRAAADYGSQGARELLAKAVSGSNVIVLEDASRRADVIFCQVVPGRWIKDGAKKPPAHVLLIDFKDFNQLFGDRAARDAFNVGWGVLHELDHVVNDSPDARSLGSAGECEDHINAMRRELDLPERVEYFFRLLPHSGQETFKSRFVRLAFERRMGSTKKKRYWLVWDATVVGGILEPTQIASVR
ncbi:MAG: hypothetical protein ACRD6N_14660, partial [Pyrinomonadaceae bacterium]